MSVILPNKYPGRFDPVSPDYPQGKFKNRSSPSAQDGSYLERDWLNDWNAFFGAVLSGANITPNGIVDTAQSSQLYAALQSVIKSTPIPTNVVYVVSSLSYTPPAGVKRVLVEVQGGGGGGGGCASTPANNANSAAGGGAGGYALGLYNVSALSAPVIVTVGTGGAGGTSAGTGGANGTASSFGSLVTASGGAGGPGQTTSISTVSRGASNLAATGGGASGLVVIPGTSGGCGVIINNTATGGDGGSSKLASGPKGRTEGTEGVGGNLGAGGAGASEGGSSSSPTIGRKGGNGGSGMVIITEFY